MAISNETSGRVLYSLREEFVGRVIPSHMVDCLSDVLNQREEEEVRAKVREHGETNGAEHLWTLLSKKPNWFEHVVRALYHEHVDLPDLAEKFINERGCLPIHVNIRAISHQNGTTLFQKPAIEHEESPMDIDDIADDYTLQAEAQTNIYEPLKADADASLPDLTKLQQPALQGSSQIEGALLDENDKMVLLDRFNTIIQGAANAEGRQIIEETLRNLELQLIAVRNGSIVFVIEPKTLEVLDNVHEMHKSGVLAKIIHQKLVTEAVMRKLRSEAVQFGIELTALHMTTLIKEKEYIALKAWMTVEKECIVVQSPFESFCLYGKSTKTFPSKYVRHEKIRQLKSLRKHLPKSVGMMVEDHFIRDDFVDDASETIFKTDFKKMIEHTKSHFFLRSIPDKEGRRLVYEIMNWISTIYDDRLSRFDENMQEILNTLALVAMGNMCIHDDETIHIEEKHSLVRVILDKNVTEFLKQEFVLLTERMHFDVPNALLIGLQTGVVEIPMNIDQLVAQDILFRLETRRDHYKFVSDVLRDFLIGASICYKTLPAVQRDVRTTLLQYFHKFKYLHIPVCNPLTCQAAQAHNQVVINVYKEIEKRDPSMADEFADTLMCSLEFCDRPEAKGWLEYFGSKLKLVHSEGTFQRPGGALSQRTKQFLSSLVNQDILYKFTICDNAVSMNTKLLIKSKLEEFTRGNLVFKGSGIFTGKTENEAIAIIRSMQVLDLIKRSGIVSVTEEGKLICELEMESPTLIDGISLDLHNNAMDAKLLQTFEACFSTVQNVVSLSLVNISNFNSNWLRKVLSRGSLSNLKSLDLSENRIIENLDRILGISFCPDLEELKLAKCGVGDKELERICTEIDSLAKLRKLDISDNHITTYGIIPLAKSFVGKYTFTSINLSGNKLGGQTTGCGLVITMLLRSIPLLEELELNNADLNHQDVTATLQNLPSTVKRLDIGGNNLSPLEQLMLREIPEKCPHLKILGLEGH